MVGELLLGGDMVTPYGYYVPKGGDPRAERNNEEKFTVRSGIRFYRTNDLVGVHPDRTVEFIGRLGNYVKLGGAFHDTNVIQEQLSEELERQCYLANYQGQLHFFVMHRDKYDRINASRLLAAVRSKIPMLDVENVHLLPANYQLPRSEGTGKLSAAMLVDAVIKVDVSSGIKRKARDTMEEIEAKRMRGTALMFSLAIPLWSLLSSPLAILWAFLLRLLLLPWILRTVEHPAGEYLAYYTPFGRYGMCFGLAQLPGVVGWYVYVLAAAIGAILAGKRKPIRALCWLPVSLIVQGPAQLGQDVDQWVGYFSKWGVMGVARWYIEQLQRLCRSKAYWKCLELLDKMYALLMVPSSAGAAGTRWTSEEYKQCSRCHQRYALNYGCSDTFYAEPWNWYCEDCWWTHIGRINESFGTDMVGPVGVTRLIGGHSSSSTCGSDTPSRGETSPSSGGSDNPVPYLLPQDSGYNSVERKVVGILAAILGEPPTSETTLMGLSSLTTVLLTARINKEFDTNLSVAEVMNSGTTLQALCKRIEMAVGASQSEAVGAPLHLKPAGGKEYAVFTNETLWTGAVCDWLLAASAPLETTRVQSAVRAIVKKHPSLRSYPADEGMDATINVLTKASGYFHLRGWGHDSILGRLLSWCVCELWPKIAVRPDCGGGPEVIECTYDVSEATDVVRCTDRLWREYPFKPPFQVFLLRPAEGDGVNYLYIKTTHLLSDGYCVLPLVMDFERFIDDPEANPVELNPYCILQKRLKDTIEMRPDVACGYNFEQQMERWQSWERGTIKRRTLWLEKETVEALTVAGQEMAVSIEVMVLAVVLLSLSRFQRWSWVSLNLMQTLRDEVEYHTQDMVAFFSDYRDMGLFPTHSSSSVNDFVYELSTRIRMRKWKAHDYTLYDHSDCLVKDLEGTDVFPVVVNLIPHNSPHYRNEGSTDDDDDEEGRCCKITNVPTYSRMMFQGAGRPSSSPMHVYIEETIPGSEWGLRFQFNEAYFNCHDVVQFVRESVRGAIRDLTSGAGAVASSQAPHRRWEGLDAQ
ncbi:hypothetical protein FOZ62_010407 [Perkinsus olseni]|uniref:Carrier domain-containing protein n=1 Tax=Perkinsus olseni TaxID=32597 RepID=A0A7J6SBE5_PEROL|nr:hypothetical protein FOZ62_010407 [Perkinsus olseni]